MKIKEGRDVIINEDKEGMRWMVMMVEEKHWIDSSFASLFFSSPISIPLYDRSLTQSRLPPDQDDVHMFLFLGASCGEGKMMMGDS